MIVNILVHTKVKTIQDTNLSNMPMVLYSNEQVFLVYKIMLKLKMQFIIYWIQYFFILNININKLKNELLIYIEAAE